jgi:aspartate/methionine/tyrosine aminotransferase
MNWNQCVKHLTADQKILIINSPNNPTGAVYSEDEIQADS